jgi:ABC-type polysaccharide/polyol phosphate export permease
MIRPPDALDGIAAVIQRDTAIYFSYRFRALSQVLVALMSVALFYYLSRLVNVTAFPSPDSYFAYVVVGLAVLHALTAILAQLPGAVRGELVAGTFERLAMSPLGPAMGIVALSCFPVLSALATGVVTLALAHFVFGLSFASATWLLALPAALLAVESLMPFALLIAAVVLRSKQAGNAGQLVVVALSLAGGVYFPPALLPPWIEWVSEVQPFTPALELLRYLLIGTETESPPAVEALRLAAFAVVALPIGYRVLLAAVAACRRRGTLIEY